MAEGAERNPRVLAIDAGGTMTDTFIVDERGRFVVGKAQTTPEDESVGFMRVGADALEQWDSSRRRRRSGAIVSGIYSRHGDAQPAALRARAGEIGAIVTAGQEDYLQVRARDPDLPRLLLRRPAARRHPLPQPAARARASG